MTGSDDTGKAVGPPTEWDAASYHRLSAPQFSWGVRVLERLHLNGDETVMDAGCGSRRLTALRARLLPPEHTRSQTGSPLNRRGSLLNPAARPRPDLPPCSPLPERAETLGRMGGRMSLKSEQARRPWGPRACSMCSLSSPHQTLDGHVQHPPCCLKYIRTLF